MNAADLAERGQGGRREGGSPDGVHRGARRGRAHQGRLGHGTLTLREEAGAGRPEPDPGENVVRHGRDRRTTARRTRSRFETLASAPPVRPAAEPEPSAFDSEVETDEDGIPKWE